MSPSVNSTRLTHFTGHSSPSHGGYYHRSRRFRPIVIKQLGPNRHPDPPLV